jgi:hypothetical protein
MNDRAATTDAPSEAIQEEQAVHAPSVPPPEESPTPALPSPGALPLEDRVRALEEQMTLLRDTRKLEDRIVERMAKRLERKQASAAIKAPVAALADAGKHLLPVAVAAMKAQADAVALAETKAGKQPWLVVDCYTEFRSMFRMFFDRRYRLTWQTKLYPPLLILLMVLSWWMVGSIPIVGTWLDKIVALVLAFFLYKILSREAQRYREICPHLPTVYSP